MRTFREENRKMEQILIENGIKAIPKYIFSGSLRGLWRIYNLKTTWFGNKELQKKMQRLGFLDFNGEPLHDLSGNGGVFQVFVRNAELTKRIFS